MASQTTKVPTIGFRQNPTQQATPEIQKASIVEAFRREPLLILEQDPVLVDLFKEGTKDAITLKQARDFLYYVRKTLADNGVETFGFVIGQLTSPSPNPKPHIDYLGRNYDRLFDATKAAVQLMKKIHSGRLTLPISTATFLGKGTNPNSTDSRIIAEFHRKGIFGETIQQEFKSHCRDIITNFATDLITIGKRNHHQLSIGTLDEINTGLRHRKRIHDTYHEPAFIEIAERIRGFNQDPRHQGSIST